MLDRNLICTALLASALFAAPAAAQVVDFGKYPAFTEIAALSHAISLFDPCFPVS